MDVLLVEDELSIREMLHDDLADAGLFVVPAPSAEEGLTAAANDNHPPRVLVTDVDLGPGMDGLALAQEAQRRWPTVAVVVITGDDRNLARMPDAMRASCLLKPFNPPRLVNRVNELMGRSAGLRSCRERARG
jgi:DNA-binding response OmpR family regulator